MKEEFSFTGVSAPYEAPEYPELTIDTANESIGTSLQNLINYMVRNIPLNKEPRALVIE
jgi:adenylylsulfate kinase-like enzyme